MRIPIYITMLCASLCMSACVSFSNEIQFQIYSHSNNVTTITAYVSRGGFYQNVHTGKSHTYHIEIPRHLNVVKADQIKIDGVQISSKSNIILNGDGPCELTLEIYSSNGKPMLFSGLDINGSYKIDAHEHSCER